MDETFGQLHVGGVAFVRIPFDVEQAFGKKRVPVLATIDGESYRGTLVRMGEPCHLGKWYGRRHRHELDPRPRRTAVKVSGRIGGLSGEPLKGQSEAVPRGIVKRAGGKIPIISTGGVMCPVDAKRRLDMGAALVHFYSGWFMPGRDL